MGHFTVIEYNGKDSAKVLARITGSDRGGIDIVDLETHHPIGFRPEISEDEDGDE